MSLFSVDDGQSLQSDCQLVIALDTRGFEQLDCFEKQGFGCLQVVPVGDDAADIM